MTKDIIFKGVGTALITPFKNSAIDYDSLGKIIDMQITHGIDALIIGGTTGEAATLSDIERYTLFEFAKEKVAGRVKLIFGTGTNDTKAAIRHTRKAAEIGCDGILVVTPYYNKGTRRGVTEHYLKISDVSEVPIILYNVPSRTGVDLSIDQLKELSMRKNIVAIKEAGDSADKYVKLAALSDSLGLYAGNDSQIYSTLALGGLGVISVLSNAVPLLAKEICNSFFSGKSKEALSLQAQALPLIDALFCETNPAPIKYAMSTLGLCDNLLRLPLAPVIESSQCYIKNALNEEHITAYLPYKK